MNINQIELAIKLAYERTLYESGDICNNEDDMYDDITSKSLLYKTEIQDRFNNWYDYYLSRVEQYKENNFREPIIDRLINSCEEGLSGEWDCSTKEGRESFRDMIEELKTLI